MPAGPDTFAHSYAAQPLTFLPTLDVDRFARKRPKDSPGQQQFHWVTIGAEEGVDGQKHGGHPVLIDDQGKMQSGKFAGQTFAQAFGGKSQSDAESQQQSAPASPTPPEPTPKPTPEPQPKPAETSSTPADPGDSGIDLPSGPDATPRDRAEAFDKASQEQYQGARSSSVSNIGEDLIGSARHRALRWRGLEAAEQDGSAAEAITREQLLKLEPHSLMTTVDTNPLASLAMYYALRKFPAKPGTSASASSEQRAKDRRQYFEAYQAIKQKAELLASTTSDAQALQAVGTLNRFVIERIEQLRRDDRYNQTANDLVALHRSLRGGYHASKSGVLSQLNEFAKGLANLPKEFDADDDSDRSIAPSQYQQASRYAARILDGESLQSAFGKTKPVAPPRFNPSDLYVQVAQRQGGKDLGSITQSAQSALEYSISTLKLRGVQWGNYVTDEERKHHATKSVEALVDLADVLGIRPEDVSLEGELGLAIGARGTGNALAHYEPDQKVINLTRSGGVGSLAHEWGHALDHYLAGFRSDFMSDDYRFTHRSVQHGRVWKIEPANAKNSRLKLEELERSEMRSAYRQFFESPEYQQYYQRVRQHVQELVRSRQMSEKKASDYWLSRKEIFARTFERYIQRKLERAGRKNTYLAGIETKSYKQGGLWPTDEETDALSEKFEGIFAAFRQQKYGSAEHQKFSRRFAQAIIERMFTQRTIFGQLVRERFAATQSASSQTRWVTIGAEVGGDGKKHGGHPVLIDREGRMQSGPFAGQTFSEAFPKRPPQPPPSAADTIEAKPNAPKKLYHGTWKGNQFERFDRSRGGEGVGGNRFDQGDQIYLTESPEAARWFGERADERRQLRSGQFPQSMQADVLEFEFDPQARVKQIDSMPRGNPAALKRIVEQAMAEGFAAIEFPDQGFRTVEGDRQVANLFRDGVPPKTTIVLDEGKLRRSSSPTETPLVDAQFPESESPESKPSINNPPEKDDDEEQELGDISFDPEALEGAISFDPETLDGPTQTLTESQPASDFISNPRLRNRFDEMGLSLADFNRRMGLSVGAGSTSAARSPEEPEGFDAAAHSTITPMAFEITSNERLQNRFKNLTLEEFNRRMGLIVKRPEAPVESFDFTPVERLPESSTSHEPAAPEEPSTLPAPARRVFRPKTRVDQAIVDTVGDDPQQVADFRNLLDTVYQLRLERESARRDAVRSLLGAYGITGQRLSSLISLLGRQDYDKIPRWGEIVRTARSSPQYAILFGQAGGESDKRGDDEATLAANLAEGFQATPPKYAPEILEEAKQMARDQGFFHPASSPGEESSSWDSSLPEYFSAQRQALYRSILDRYRLHPTFSRAS